MKYRVAISGSYGGLNLGDEAILEVILRELRASLDVDIVVFSRNPKDTERRRKVIEPPGIYGGHNRAGLLDDISQIARQRLQRLVGFGLYFPSEPSRIFELRWNDGFRLG